MQTLDIDIWDRPDLLEALQNAFELTDSARMAVITVDMSERHARRGLPPGKLETLLSDTSSFLDFARKSGIPVIHVISALRPIEAGYMKRWASEERTGQSPSPYGGPSSEVSGPEGAFEPDILPGIFEDGDYIIKTKKTFSAFHGTDLSHLLLSLKRDVTVFCGMDTNGSIQGTVFDANNLGYGTVAIADCCASTYGDDLHELALEQLRRCLAWTFTIDEFQTKLAVKV